MAKNLIPVIMEELNLQVDEEFEVDGTLYRFTHENLEFYYTYDNKWLPASEITVGTLVLGKKEITKVPFEPKEGEDYWTYWLDWNVVCFKWAGGKTVCEFRKFCGCIFRTREEAERELPVKYKELTGKEWDGRSEVNGLDD